MKGTFDSTSGLARERWRLRLYSLQNLEAESDLLVFEELPPVDEEENADDNQAGNEGYECFPVRLTVNELADVRACVFAGEDKDAVRYQPTEEERDQDMKRPLDASHRDGREKSGR